VTRYSFIEITAANRNRIPETLCLCFHVCSYRFKSENGEILLRVATLIDVQAKCEFLTAVPLNSQVWWDVPPREIINSY
jgi:hypothetical protein